VRYRVVLVDDEPPARAKLKRLLATHGDFEVTGEAGSVGEAVDLLRRERPEVIYLDVRLGDRTGFDALDELSPGTPPLIVFTTAYSEFALRAFEVAAADYLLKPFDKERFFGHLERLRGRLQELGTGSGDRRQRDRVPVLQPPAPYVRQLVVPEHERSLLIAVDSIDSVSASGNYVEIVANGKTHVLRESLTGLRDSLDPLNFVQIHRSHLVRLGAIAELRPLFHGDYEVVLRDGRRLPLSRRFKSGLPVGMRDRL
jgi:two-component system LytT family response regulator